MTNNWANLRRLRFVPRWAVVATIREQNVAEHSFHVLWIHAWLAEKFRFTVGSYYDALRILTHDDDEAVSGDAPSPSKGFASTESADAAKCWLKVADCLEAALFMREEAALGNSTTAPIEHDAIYRGQLWVERLRSFGWQIDGGFERVLNQLWDEVDTSKHPMMKGIKYDD